MPPVLPTKAIPAGTTACPSTNGQAAPDSLPRMNDHRMGGSETGFQPGSKEHHTQCLSGGSSCPSTRRRVSPTSQPGGDRPQPRLIHKLCQRNTLILSRRGRLVPSMRVRPSCTEVQPAFDPHRSHRHPAVSGVIECDLLTPDLKIRRSGRRYGPKMRPPGRDQIRRISVNIVHCEMGTGSDCATLSSIECKPDSSNARPPGNSASHPLITTSGQRPSPSIQFCPDYADPRIGLPRSQGLRRRDQHG